MHTTTFPVLLCALMFTAPSALAQPDWLRDGKFLGSRGHRLTAEHVERCHKLGLNVVFVSMAVPFETSTPEFARTVTALGKGCRRAKELGVHVFLGYHTFDPDTVRTAVKDNPRRRVDAQGKLCQAPCLLDPHYWSKVFVDRAVVLTEGLSREDCQFDGFLFDIEIYRLKGWGELCYCDACFAAFAASQGKPSPWWSG